MNTEAEFGRVTHDVLGAISDAITANLTSLLKSEMNMSDDQVRKVTSVTRSTVESVGYRGVTQYVNLHNSLGKR